MRKIFIFSVIQSLVSAEKQICSNSFRNETIECSDDEPQGKNFGVLYQKIDWFNVKGKSVMVIYNDWSTSRWAQRIPYKDKD